jgi:hypothetical protein
MRDRIESLNGIFEIESRIGGGTLVRASFKISDENEALTQSSQDQRSPEAVSPERA